jgi:hypothetical protein
MQLKLVLWRFFDAYDGYGIGLNEAIVDVCARRLDAMAEGRMRDAMLR